MSPIAASTSRVVAVITACAPGALGQARDPGREEGADDEPDQQAPERARLQHHAAPVSGDPGEHEEQE